MYKKWILYMTCNTLMSPGQWIDIIFCKDTFKKVELLNGYQIIVLVF